MFTVQTLIEDAKTDARVSQLEGDPESRLVRELSNAYRFVRQLQATYLGHDEHCVSVDIPLTAAAGYTIDNLGHVVHVEDSDTWQIVEPNDISARAIDWNGIYPTGRTIRVFYIPDYPDLIQGTATGGSTTYIDFPSSMDYGVIDTQDDRYNKIKFETLSGTGSGQVLLGTDYTGGSTRRLTVTLEDGSAAAVVASGTVFCTFLQDIHPLFRPIIRDYALTMMTASADKGAIIEARIKGVLGLLGIKSQPSNLALGAHRGRSGLFWRRTGRNQIQVLGQYGASLGHYQGDIMI